MPTVDAEIELDRMSLEVLKLLDELGGEATSSDLKEALGHDHTSSLNYRKDRYLEPTGLIETEEASNATGTRGSIPPQLWSLTEKGKEVVTELHSGDASEGSSVLSRVDSLEGQVRGLQESLQELKSERETGSGSMGTDFDDGALADLSEQLGEVQYQLDAVVEDLRSLNYRIKRLEDDRLFDASMRNQINAAIAMGSVSKEALSREYGESNIMQIFENKMNEKTLLRPARFEAVGEQTNNTLASTEIDRDGGEVAED